MSATQGVPRYPESEQEWEAQRDTITRLYRDENRMLKEVIAVMHDEHQFKATENMFKKHINKWGLDKRNKEGDMLAIVRKHTQRSAVGKQSKFNLRNKKVNLESIFRFMQRKGLSVEEVVAQNAPTPPSLEVYTPPRSPSSHNNVLVDPHMVEGAPQSHVTDKLRPENSTVQPRQAPGALSQQGYVVHSNIQDIQRALTPLQRWTTDRTPFEILLSTIKDYTTGSIKTGIHSIDGNDHTVYSLKDLDGKGQLSLIQTLNYLKTIIFLLKSDVSSQDATQVELLLVRTGVEIKAALASEPLYITWWILKLLGHLQQNYDSPRCRYALKRMYKYFSDMASTIFKTYEHPVARMCTYLSDYAPETEVIAVAEGHRVLTDIFEDMFGDIHYETILAKISLYSHLWDSDPNEAIILLVGLLERVTEACGLSNTKTLSVMQAMAAQCLKAHDYTMAEVYGMKIVETAWNLGVRGDDVHAFEVVSYSQYAMDRIDNAIESLQMAADLREEYDSMDPGILHHLVTLQQWMVKKGDLVGAARVKARRDEVFERHMPELI